MGKLLNHYRGGFTAIELLIYISLVAVVTIIFTNFTVDVVRAASRALVVKEVNQGARLVISRITQEIKTARTIDSVAGDQIQFTDASDTSIRISFNSGDETVYINDGSGDVAIAPTGVRVTSLTFKQLTPKTIGFDVTFEQKNTAATAYRYSFTFSDVAVTPRFILY